MMGHTFTFNGKVFEVNRITSVPHPDRMESYLLAEAGCLYHNTKIMLSLKDVAELRALQMGWGPLEIAHALSNKQVDRMLWAYTGCEPTCDNWHNREYLHHILESVWLR